MTHDPIPPIRPETDRWRVILRGELLGHVYADNWPAACERAVRRWQISADDQQALSVEREDIEDPS